MRLGKSSVLSPSASLGPRSVSDPGARSLESSRAPTTSSATTGSLASAVTGRWVLVGANKALASPSDGASYNDDKLSLQRRTVARMRRLDDGLRVATV